CSREALKEPFESPRVHGPQQYAGVRAKVLEGMRHIFRDEDERAGWCALDALAELEVELSAQNIKELILGSVDLQRRPPRYSARVPPHPERTPCLLAGRKHLCGVCLAPDGTQEAGSSIGKHDESLFLGGCSH